MLLVAGHSSDSTVTESTAASDVALPMPLDSEVYSYASKPSDHPQFKVGYTISLTAWTLSLIGMFMFAFEVPLYFVIFIPMALMLSFFYFISIRNNMHYKRFDLQLHQRLVEEFLANEVRPTVDILLPVCGESIPILRNTWEGVRGLAYPADCVKVYVLDDAASDATRALAVQFGFTYVVRPDRGKMKKAGNLKYGLSQCSGDFVVILDADFRPHPHFLRHTMPQMLFEDRRAIIQTPQFFDYNDAVHDRSPLEYGAGNIQEYFYKIVQVGRSFFGSAICVGSCALYRRSALDKAGGTYQIEHSEDVWTGFSLLRLGYQVQYVPLIVSKGVCPDDANAYYKQQSRWASGSLSLGSSAYFWKAPVSWRIRLPFFAGFLYYLTAIPFLMLHFSANVLLWLAPHYLGWVSTIILAVSWINAYVLLRYHIYPRARYGTLIAFMASVWTYGYTVVNRYLFRRIEGWVPTGSGHSLSAGFLGVVRWATIYTVANLVALVSSLWAMEPWNIHHYPIIIITAVFLYLNTVYLHAMRQYISEKRGAAAAGGQGSKWWSIRTALGSQLANPFRHG